MSWRAVAHSNAGVGVDSGLNSICMCAFAFGDGASGVGDGDSNDRYIVFPPFIGDGDGDSRALGIRTDGRPAVRSSEERYAPLVGDGMP